MFSQKLHRLSAIQTKHLGLIRVDTRLAFVLFMEFFFAGIHTGHISTRVSFQNFAR